MDREKETSDLECRPKPKAKTYRQRLKATDPARYREYLEKQKERAKAYRKQIKELSRKKTLTEYQTVQVEKFRVSSKNRQKRYNDKLKEKGIKRPKKETTKDKRPKTRKELSLQREKWRTAKQKYRESLSSYKKRWIREKDKSNKRKKREAKRLEKVKPTLHDENVSVSMKTLQNTASKVKQSLPTTPNDFASVIIQIENSSTPRKPKALQSQREQTKRRKLNLQDESISKERQSETDKLSCKGNKSNENEKSDKEKSRKRNSANERKKSNVRFLTEKLKNRSMMTLNKSRRKRSDKTSLSTKKVVADFYYKTGRPLPHKRFATKFGPAYLMQLTLKSAYRQFRLEHPMVKIGFTKFTLLRPRNVRLLSRSHWEFCVCTVCQNIRYKVQALNLCAAKHGMQHLKITNEHRGLYELILCPKSMSARFHEPDCIYGNCVSCKNYDNSIKNHYKDLISINPMVVWHHWERTIEEGIARKRLITKKKRATVLFEEFITDIEKPVVGTTFPKHLFQADWQQMQFGQLKSKLPDNAILMVCDFGKNRTLQHQDQAKSDHYNAKQVTVHPIVMYYKSLTVPDLIVRDAMIIVTDDLKHDHLAVKHFQGIAFDYLQKTLCYPVEKVFVFSDGCAAQYKGKGTMATLSESHINYGLDIEWNYFGSEHGKSEADGEMGSLNRSLDKAVQGRQIIISSAKELVEWGNKEGNLKLDEPGTKRHFHHVENGTIIREGVSEVKTLCGIRSLHQIRNISVPLQLKVRRLSCFCKKCIATKYGTDCPDSRYVDVFQIKTLKLCETAEFVKNSKQGAPSRQVKQPKASMSCESDEKKAPLKQQNQNEKFRHEQPNSKTVARETTRFFDELYEKMMDCTTYQVLKKLVGKYWRKMPVLPPYENEQTLVDLHLTGDRVSLPLVPEILQENGYCPVKIYGDGNCLPRCASVLAYGNESHFKEMRVRIVMELVHNENKYLLDSYLSKGANQATEVAKTFAMFSEHFRGEILTNLAIRRIYQHETLACCKSGTYMGAWQVASLANILNTIVESVYPPYGGRTIQNDLNRKFYPFNSAKKQRTVHIMWTNMKGVLLQENKYSVNHFVVLLKTHQSFSTNVEVETDTYVDATKDVMTDLLEQLECQLNEEQVKEIFSESNMTTIDLDGPEMTEGGTQSTNKQSDSHVTKGGDTQSKMDLSAPEMVEGDDTQSIRNLSDQKMAEPDVTQTTNNLSDPKMAEADDTQTTNNLSDPMMAEADVTQTTNNWSDPKMAEADVTQTTNNLSDPKMAEADVTQTTNNISDQKMAEPDDTQTTNNLSDQKLAEADVTQTTNNLSDPKMAEADHTQTTNNLSDPKMVEADVTQTTNNLSDPKMAEADVTQTTNNLSDPKMAEAYDTQTTNNFSDPMMAEADVTQTTNNWSDPKMAEADVTQTTNILSDPKMAEADVTQTTNNLSDPKMAEADVTQTTNNLSDPMMAEADGTQTTNNISDQKMAEPDDTQTTNNLSDQKLAEADVTQTTNNLSDPKMAEADHTQTTNNLSDPKMVEADVTQTTNNWSDPKMAEADVTQTTNNLSDPKMAEADDTQTTNNLSDPMMAEADVTQTTNNWSDPKMAEADVTQTTNNLSDPKMAEADDTQTTNNISGQKMAEPDDTQTTNNLSDQKLAEADVKQTTNDLSDPKMAEPDDSQTTNDLSDPKMTEYDDKQITTDQSAPEMEYGNDTEPSINQSVPKMTEVDDARITRDPRGTDVPRGEGTQTAIQVTGLEKTGVNDTDTSTRLSDPETRKSDDTQNIRGRSSQGLIKETTADSSDKEIEEGDDTKAAVNPSDPEITECNDTLTTTDQRRAKMTEGDDIQTTIDHTFAEMKADNGYQTGQHLLVQHGNKQYPIIVLEWPWVNFYNEKSPMWIKNDIPYMIDSEDVLHTIDAPLEIKRGKRVY